MTNNEILKNFAKIEERNRQAMKLNKNVFQDWEERNKAISKETEQVREQSIKAIKDNYSEEVKNIGKKWNFLKVEDFTPDKELLNIPNLPNGTFNALVDKYKDNGAMLALLQDYKEKNNRSEFVPTFETDLREASNRQQSAIHYLEVLSGNDDMTRGFARAYIMALDET